MTRVKTFHHSGRWDRPVDALASSVRRTRKGGFSIGTRTEAAGKAHHDVLKAWDGWGVYHPLTRYGYVDCSIEWDLDVWHQLDHQLVKLTELRIWTRKGFLLPPSFMPTVKLQHIDTGRVLNVGTAHMQLSNTHTRRKAWNQEAANVKRWALECEERGEDVLYQADLNRDQRLLPMRWKVNRAMLKGTELHSAWRDDFPQDGTHGRAILDAALTSLRGSSYLLPDDDSSDHRPFGSTLLLSRR